MGYKQKNFKVRVINNAAELFMLNTEEKESLANKAGLSFCKDDTFSSYFSALLKEYPYTYKTLYNTAQVSERMFRNIRYTPSKMPLLALAITLGLNVDDIQLLLKKAGYVLSRSLANDSVVLWLLSHDERPNKDIPMVSYINEILDEFSCPLLMTRMK